MSGNRTSTVVRSRYGPLAGVLNGSPIVAYCVECCVSHTTSRLNLPKLLVAPLEIFTFPRRSALARDLEVMESSKSSSNALSPLPTLASSCCTPPTTKSFHIAIEMHLPIVDPATSNQVKLGQCPQ